jgi:long-chain acyl-CoA synthetase
LGIDTFLDSPTISLLHTFSDQFDEIVRRFPDRPAVSVRRDDGVERFSYRELDVLARRAALFLDDLGLRAGERCAILAENSALWCAAYLGILRLGAIAVPFDTSYKAPQVATLLADAGATVLLTSPRLAAVAREAAAAHVRVEVLGPDLWAAASGSRSESVRAVACPAGPSDPAVILYTSGTTADPKGVVLTHANLLAEKDGAFAIVQVSEEDSVLGVLPLFHALAQMANLLLPFSVGAHVVFLDALNTRELLRALDEEGITIFVCVPQFFYLIHRRVTEEVEKRGAIARRGFRVLAALNRRLRSIGLNVGPWLFARVHRTVGRRMRMLITGGSKFDESIGRDLHDLGLTILQAYGLTETSGAATITTPGEPISTVGRPLPGVEIEILPAPGGSHGDAELARDQRDGEILIRGPIVMQGYWKKAEATAAVLRDGWLHTGDLGYLDEDGRLTITGRSKDVIVLSSGKNIYPEEIETHYRQSPFVRELCVIGVTPPGQPSAERLHALVVPDTEVLRERKIVNTGELVRFELEGLSVSLPPHKRVLGFDVWMEPLARTTTGKLKRHEILKQWRARQDSSAQPRVEANDEITEPHVARVIDAVRSVVGPEVRVRPDSNLELDLGLDSMQRVELLALLEGRFGLRVPEAVAQSAFVVRDLAEVFRHASDSGGTVELPWASMLDAGPDRALQTLVRPRRISAMLLFAATRALVRPLMRPRAIGLEHLPGHGPYIVSPNHQSYLDPFVLVSVLPFHVFRDLFFVGAAEYFEHPLAAWLARQVNIVPVDPDANLVPAMQAGAFGLRQGKVLVLFPEGERSIDGQVKRFKKGAAILSRHLDVPIVPVAIDGVFEIWGRNRALDWRKLLPWSGHRTLVRVGPPLRAGGMSYEQQTARLREAVETMWNELSASGARSA